MSRVTGRCPNCSAPVAFTWSSSVQTVCGHCRSVVVRHDVDLAAVGEVSDLPPDSSAIQIGTTGAVDGAAFTVVGRIAYEWEDGAWNEWHLVFADGSSGWLSDAQAEYAVSRQVQKPGPLPKADDLRPGKRFQWNRDVFSVTTLTRARYRGVDGELPFEYWGREEVLFADLRTTDRGFATLDYSEDPPLLFVGVAVDFDELSLKNLRDLEARAAGATRGFNCRQCGAAIELRALELTKTVACTSCGTIQDPDDPNVTILQEAKRRERITPSIPLGSRGALGGVVWQVIGFQYRTITVEGDEFGWNEYVLFNPNQGFRYLSEYEGHWNVIRTLRSLPDEGRSGGRSAAEFDGRTFRHFQTASASTRFVLGEFPWRVRVGDLVRASDYVAPPRMLSAEQTDDETTWSLGEYTPGREIWKAFDLPGRPPRARGVFANQPSPYEGRPTRYWLMFGLLALIVLAAMGFRYATAAREQVFQRGYTYQPGAPGEAAFVTPVFEIRERPSSVEVAINTDLSNNWVYYNLALINEETGTALDFGREVSYYFGRDSDGAWSEGSKFERTILPEVPTGRYYLRVEPEGGTAPVRYGLIVRRDVPRPTFYVIVLGLLLVPPVLVTLRRFSFEAKRWQESDYAE